MKPQDFQRVTSLFKRGIIAPMAVFAGAAAVGALSA
jgi:hypothetical protein